MWATEHLKGLVSEKILEHHLFIT